MLKRLFSRMSVGVIVSNAVRLILVLGFISSFYRGRELAMVFTIVAFIATFIPKILAKFDIQTGAEMQVVVLLIVYGSLFLGEVRGLFAYLWWWDILLKSVAGMALGFIGLTVILALEEQELLDASPFMIITLSFALSFTLGALWEIVEFSLDELFDFALQRIGTGVTTHDLIIDAVTALVVSAGGYLYKKRAGGNPMSGFIVRLMKGNPKIFRSQKHLESSSDKIKSIIQKGEGPKIEFKSSLRTNLYTNAIDKNIEYSVLKTLVAYLNMDGGILIVGVSDKGDILGMEKDAFPNSDKLKLHFNNMIKEHIGTQFMNFINYELFDVDGRSVLKIECLPSTNRVFLKENGQEEFYIRNGPSTMKLNGGALIDYISLRFN